MLNLSRILHDLLFRDTSQSLCSRAWDRRHKRGWALWVWVFGARHCERSWRWYRRPTSKQ